VLHEVRDTTALSRDVSGPTIMPGPSLGGATALSPAGGGGTAGYGHGGAEVADGEAAAATHLVGATPMLSRAAGHDRFAAVGQGSGGALWPAPHTAASAPAPAYGWGHAGGPPVAMVPPGFMLVPTPSHAHVAVAPPPPGYMYAPMPGMYGHGGVGGTAGYAPAPSPSLAVPPTSQPLSALVGSAAATATTLTTSHAPHFQPSPPHSGGGAAMVLAPPPDGMGGGSGSGAAAHAGASPGVGLGMGPGGGGGGGGGHNSARGAAGTGVEA